MTACGKGETAALDELYQRYHRAVFALAYRYLRNPERASDAVQETFFRVFRSRETYRPSSKFSSWLFRVARNYCIDEKRRYWNRQVISESQAGSPGGESYRSILDVQAASGPTGADDVIEDEVSERIRDAVERLSPDQKEVIILSKYQGLSYVEIAGMLGVSAESVKQRAYRAHVRLREALKDLLE